MKPAPGAGIMKPLRLSKAGLSDYRMHFLYALVRKSSFSKAQGFIIPATGVISRGVTSTQFFYLSKSKSNSSQNYSSKSKSTDSKKLLK